MQKAISNGSINAPTTFTEYTASNLDQRHWLVLWTRSNCEQLVHDQLTANGFDALLPKIPRYSQHKGRSYLKHIPMFAGYLFLHHAIDKYSYISLCKTKGLVRILGERWDRLGTVPEQQMQNIQKVMLANLTIIPHAYLRQGQRVRVISGPLANIEGIVLKYESKKSLLIISVELMQRSIGVPIDCALVRPI